MDLRFAGDVGLVPTVLLALLAAAGAWWVYRREVRRGASPWLAFTLPALRVTVVLLLIMMLAGPVVHHRQVSGELGRVLMFVDASKSMSVDDAQMGVERKLLAAQHRGWLPEGTFDTTLAEAADALGEARRLGSQGRRSDQTPAALSAAIANLEQHVQHAGEMLRDLEPGLLEGVATADGPTEFEPWLAGFSEQVVSAAVALAAQPLDDAEQAEAARAELRRLGQAAAEHEQTIRRTFANYAEAVRDSGDRSVQAALSRFDGMSRWQRIETLLLAGGGEGVLGELAGRHDVELLALDGSEVRRLWMPGEGEGLPDELGTEPRSMDTDLVAGVRDRLAQLGGRSGEVADSVDEGAEAPADENAEEQAKAAEAIDERTAVVLFSDGQHNRGGSPLRLARLLGDQQVPMFSVGVGADVPPADVALLGLEAPENVFRDDRMEGEIVLLDHLPGGEPFTARIKHEGEVVWEQELSSENAGRRRVSFDFPVAELVDRRMQAAEDEGVDAHSVPFSMQVSVGPIEGQAREDNTEAALHFNAIGRAYRLLLIDGRPRWEMRYLRNLFDRDSRWQVDTVLAGPATEQSTIQRGRGDGAFPDDRETLFDYDLVVFGELPTGLLDEDDLERLRDFVQDRGGGVVFIDGPRGHLADYRSTPIGPLLPVQWQSGEADTFMPESLALSDDGARRSALRLSVEHDRREVWQSLPPPSRVAPVTVTAGAGEVLVEAVFEGDRRVPLVVERRVGAGRVLYLGADESWRWRYRVADLYHERFWNQVAGYVMESPYQVADEFVSIDPGAVVHRPGEPEPMRVRLRDEQGQPVLHATAEVVLWRDEQPVASVELEADENRGGVFRGRSPGLEPGAYEASVRVTGVPDDQMRARARFVVEPEQTGELAILHANEDLLRQMADASGGVYLREEYAHRLPDMLEPISAGRVVHTETALAQSYWWFAAMIGLLSIEWLLRKRSGML